VEEPRAPLASASEWVVDLDDWLDRDPDEVLAELCNGMAHGGMGHAKGASGLLGGVAGNVQYPHFLLNGRVPADAEVFQAKPGQRVRIRFINASGDTVFRVALGGHRMSVTHTDGFPVVPIDTDALLIRHG
jgi:FtsP/CotA-like multicopper oxidase with cupredoxin domain